jgi:hypothetical protein
LSAAASFGHANGWPSRERVPVVNRSKLLEVLSADLRGQVLAILEAGHRIPEEVLGPDELRATWSRS